jgi:putative transposase
MILFSNDMGYVLLRTASDISPEIGPALRNHTEEDGEGKAGESLLPKSLACNAVRSARSQHYFSFAYLCSILDGYSCFLVHWDLREQMTEADIEIILERAKERFPGLKPRVISDNGPQFIAKEFIRISGMMHVRTSPYYPQSNGKIERWHKSLKGECIRPRTPLSFEDARRLVEGYVDHYNDIRLNSAIGYITPKDMLAGHQQEIQADRDRKLEVAREQRKNRRQRAA